MLRVNRKLHPSFPAASGFSLIEVMVAVVILATGLLALAALQGALSRSSAEAKARSAIMAALTSRMNEIRQAPPTEGREWTITDASPEADWVDVAAHGAGAVDLVIEESIQTFYWDVESGGYVEDEIEGSDSEFTRASLEATWTGTSGTKSLALSSDLSGAIYGDNGFPEPPGASSSASKFPVMRRKNPGLTEGVIPIAFGSSATAASNPQPDIEGPAATRFEVMTYTPETGGKTAIVTKRFDTKAVSCRCQLGSGSGQNGVAQWPAEWTGLGYKVYKPADGAPPPGVATAGYEDPLYAGSGGGNGNGNGNGGGGGSRVQSPQCTQCCRDYRPSTGTGIAFDPEDPTHVLMNVSATGGPPIPVGDDGKFVASCRVIQVEGYWRTATDIYARQFSLLKTRANASGKAAGTGVPEGPTDGVCPDGNSTATCAYQRFVKSYLAGYLTSGGDVPDGAYSTLETFESGILNNPSEINITTPANDDLRFLHARGLYVDHLGETARKKITAAACSTVECILPYLPFTSINTTELAAWSRTASGIVVSPGGNLALALNVAEPKGGRTYGDVNNTTASARASLRASNSGLAAGTGGQVVANGPNIDAVDTTDAASTLTDINNQKFVIGAGGSGTGGEEDECEGLPCIFVAKSNYSYTIPNVQMVGTGAECFIVGTTRKCTFALGGLPAIVELKIFNYNMSDQEGDRRVVTNPCTNSNGNPNSTPTVNQPFRRLFDVTSSDPAGTLTAFNDGTVAEYSIFQSTSTMDNEQTVILTFSDPKVVCPSFTCPNGNNKTPTWSTGGAWSTAQCR